MSTNDEFVEHELILAKIKKVIYKTLIPYTTALYP
jgi:hypothetical protein